MKLVALQPVDDSALVTTGAPLLSALLARDMSVLMSCGGKGICSTCHVHIREGMDELSPVGSRERRTLSLVANANSTSRLACQSRVLGDGVVVDVPQAMYIERAEDLLALLGTHAPQNILHPITGVVLVPKGKIVTRTMLEQSRGLEQEVRKLKVSEESSSVAAGVSTQRSFLASGTGSRPHLSSTTQLATRLKSDSPSTVRPPVVHPAKTQQTVHKPSAPRTDRTLPPMTYRTPDHHATRSVVGSSVPLTPQKSTGVAHSPLKAGTQVDKYLLIECVGKGGAGVVFRALHTKLKTPVAVKFLRPDVLSANVQSLERFTREAQLLAQLVHPNVVRVLDYEDAADRPYVVMEFVDGTTAADLIQLSGRVALGRAIEIVLQIADGLEAAHQMGIVHRDVKPGNILVARSGTSKLVDLGLAVSTRPNGPAVPEADTGIIEGTVGYMSPEQIQGTTVDHRSDIYALGATFYHLVTGRMPFTGRTSIEVIMKHLHHHPAPPHEVVPGLPPELEAVFATMMAKAPDDRYQSCRELRTALQMLFKTGEATLSTLDQRTLQSVEA